jgi:hypothetical protein
MRALAWAALGGLIISAVGRGRVTMSHDGPRCAAKTVRKWATVSLTVVWLLLTAVVSARADDKTQTRTFAVTVDGKPAGRVQFRITDHGNDAQTVETHARVNTRIFFVRYTYEFDGTEEWKEGRLMKLESNANDDGTRMSVSAEAEGDQLMVRTKGWQNKLRWDVWTTTYWRLPAERFRKHGGVPLLDADTGNYLDGSLTFERNDKIDIAGKSVATSHYHIKAEGIDVHVWYDAEERLVRQTALEQRHLSVFTLTSISP